MKIKSILTKPLVLLFFSAILSALPLTFSSLFFLSWVSFVPLFYVIITKSGDKIGYAIGRGFLFGFIYHVCIYYWFIWFYPLDYVNFSPLESIGFVILAWFGISAVHGVLWCIPFVCCHIASKLVKNNCFLTALAIVGIMAAQKLTGVGELPFPWARISLGQYKATALIQLASVVGIDGVDMLMLFVNALIALCIVYPFKKRIVAGVVASTLFLANLSFGIIKLNTSVPATETLTILTAQASVPQDEKWASEGDTLCYDVYSKLTKENFTDNIDLIIWPESAVPKIYTSKKSLKHYETLSQELDTPILAGIILGTEEHNTNNTLLIDKDGLKATYTKRQLVPFGEYMPYAKMLSRVFPMLTELNIIEDDYISGNSSAIMQIYDAKIGNVICFESIYPKLTRKSSLDGAQIIIEATNDSWLETSPAMYQHLAHGVFRSIENGRFLVRSTNSGVSAIIDSAGRIQKSLNINEVGTLTSDVNLYSNHTIYTKIGDVVFNISTASVLIWWLIYLSKYLIHKLRGKINERTF